MVAIAPVSAQPRLIDPAEGDARNRRGPFRPDKLASVRQRLSGSTVARLFRCVDGVAVVGLALATALIAAPQGLLALPFGVALPLLVGPSSLLWSLYTARAYGLGQRESLKRHLARVFAACVVAGGVTQIAAVATPAAQAPALVWIAVATAVLLGVHAWAWRAVHRWRREGRLTPNIVVVGATENAARLIQSALDSREVNVLGIFDDRSDRAPGAVKGVPVLGDTHCLLEHKILPYVDRIVITVTASAQVRVRSLIERLRVLPNAVTLFVDIEGHDTRAATLSRLADAPLNQVSGVHEDERRAFWKRIQDLVLGSVALVPALPVMALVAVAVRLDSPGPILFRQRRHGFNNEAIQILKFRSMRVEATDHTARQQVQRDDDRVTRVGRFIRRTSLDELPQLFNVLRGEMSLVGPRPHPIGMITDGEESQRLVAEYAWRHRMKPGITGWAQINGSRGPVHTREEVRERVVLDVEYIERQSFGFDLYILLMTLPRLLGDRDAVR